MTQTRAPIPNRPKRTHAPLSLAQRRLWILHQLDPQSPEYNISRAWRLTGPLNIRVLQAILNTVVARHEALRTTFQDIDGQANQVIQPSLTVPFTQEDWSAYTPAQLDTNLAQFRLHESLQPFNLCAGPLLRFTLIQCGANDHVLIFTIHHIVFDGTSLKNFCQELSRYYAATLAGQPNPLAPLPIQFQDFVCWEESQVTAEKLASQLEYWKQQLQGAPLVFEFPSDLSRSKEHPGLRHFQAFTLEPQIVSQLKQLIQPQGITMFMALLAIFTILLFRYTSQRDILVGTPIAGRTHPDLEPLMGFFVNTLVLRTRTIGHPTFREVLQQVRKSCLEAYRHQKVPFEKLVKLLNPVRDSSRSPVVQVIFQMRHQADRELVFPEVRAQALPDARQPGNFDLHLICEETQSGINGFVYYAPAIYSDAFMGTFAKHYQILLDKLIVNPDTPLTHLTFLTDAERRQLVEEWNDTTTTYPQEACIHQLFEAQVAQTPDTIAVVLGGQHLTYAQLNKRSNQLAHGLQREGVGPEVLIGVCLDRDVDLIVSLLGILKSGAGYVPLDPNTPQQRMAYIIDDVKLRCLVTTSVLKTRLPLGPYGLILLDSDQPWIAQEPERNVETRVRPENLAYVMYTSGSTGKPKGTLISQRSVVRLVKGIHYAKLDTQERFLQIAPIAFDASTFEVWGSLLNGATLVVYPSGPLSLENLGAMLEIERISTVWLTATLFHQMVEQEGARLGQVAQILAGGDVLAPQAVQRLVKHMGKGTLINGYGPTENTTFTCCHPMTHENQVESSVPIGRPISHTHVYVVDPAQQLVPMGISGELLVCGDGLARGYVNQPALTAKNFVPHPFNGAPGARVYKTGDQVRWKNTGVLEFLGRQDSQIKLRGYRIELGEIEVVLNQHPSIQDTVVLCREDRPGEKQLVAYVVVSPQSTLSSWTMREALATLLPDYMIPTAFVALEQLPLTPNGKVNRRALPPPRTEDRLQGQSYVEPRTPNETALVGIWQEVLALERVGIHDNFFELGGHSLLATQVISRMRKQLQLDVAFPTLFDRPTIAQLAKTLEAQSRPIDAIPAPPLCRQPYEGPLPLSFAQERFWFLEQVEQGEGVFCIPVLLRLKGALNIEALEKSFHTLIQRHEILRTIFQDKNGEPVQVIVEDREWSLSLVDIKGQTAHQRFEAVSPLVERFVLQPFALRHGPLMKTVLFRGLESEFFLLITFHHIISDGWSVGIFTEELISAYEAHSKGREPNLSSLPIQYADYTLWQHDWLQGERLDGLLSYWRHQLAGAPAALSLPTDHPRILAKTFRAASERFHLPVSLTRQLKEVARKSGATLFMVLLATFKVLLARYTRCFDILVGTPIANRSNVDLEKLLGFFANTLVIRTDLSHNPSFRTILARVRKSCLEAYRHQDLPFEKLVKDLRPDRDSIRHPLIQVLFAFQNAPTPSWELEGLQVGPISLDSKKVAFDVSFSMREQQEEIQGSLTYQIELFDRGTITRMLGHFQSLIESIIKTPDQSIASLTLLTEQEQHDLLAHNEERPISHRNGRLIHIWFQQHAAKNPDTIALVYEDEHMTYGQLNERANQLAHYLKQRKVKPEMRIALHLERSPNLIVGLLGILKAGGCYVPLDPTIPSERLNFILKEACVSMVLTDNDRGEEWSRSSIPHLPLDDGTIFAYQCKKDSPPEVNAENLAYIIFTSGSTGLPKGVGVTHTNVVRLFEQTQDWFHFDKHDTWTVFHSLAFDFSVWELFGALLHGGKMVLIPYWVSRAPDTFYDCVINEQITILNQTPSAFQQFIQAEGSAITHHDLALRLVIFGGEALDFQMLTPWWDRHGDQTPQLINMYGITETTVHVTYRPLTEKDLETPGTSRIGHPIPDLQLFILDQFQQLVPIGVPGEMYVSGQGVTRGYLHQGQLTGARFIPNPYSFHPGARLYRSGDLARYLANGDIEYLGRIDHQVKIRGFRIELGEIESVLAQHPEIYQAVVIVRENQLEDKRLVAYLVVVDDIPLSIPTLRTYLSQRLPNYMIPATFMILPSLPLTSNSKIDREKLPTPESGRENSNELFEHPRSPIEEKLVTIWSELLKVEHVGIRDSFFDLGGHSLILTKLANRIQDTFQVRFPLRVIFDLPTIEQMGKAIVEEQVKKADQGTIMHLLSKLHELTPEQVSELLRGQNKR